MLHTSDEAATRTELKPLPSPAGVASEAITFATAYAAKRLGPNADASMMLREGDGTALGYLRYALALRLADYLAQADDGIKGVFLYDVDAGGDEMEASPPTGTSPLNLIAWTERKTAALGALIAELDLLTTSAYVELVGMAARGISSLLDVNVVEDRDVRERSGYGAVLCSTRERPQQVWPER